MDMTTDLQSALHTRIIENLHTAVLLLDGSLRLEFMNPAGEMLFAVSASRFIGHPAQEVLIDRELSAALEQVLASGTPITERELVLNLGYRPKVTVDLTAIPLIDADGREALLVEMKQVDRQLRITREEGLLAQSYATRALVRGLAHEIKNPLGGLRGAAQLLERELNNEELKEYTNIIISEADRLQALMNRMLGPNSLPRKRRINIHEVVERVRQLVNAELSETVTIHRDYDPSIPEIDADADQLIQALLNLVRNAAQAVGERGEITLRTRTLRQYTIGHTLHKLVARIDVIDNGPGIAAEMRESLFLPMVTGRADGTGLGLPIAQSLINLNGGLIEWESRPGHTVFTILLPIEMDLDNRQEKPS
ncbi:MAG TPA: nitrogen regulation protein NR(II) [Gammaproteobacteria bacterium]|jgi:two-component system nitrogen regulation sensor histidine kinase GlnL